MLDNTMYVVHSRVQGLCLSVTDYRPQIGPGCGVYHSEVEDKITQNTHQ